jgi:hypothetical protein
MVLDDSCQKSVIFQETYLEFTTSDCHFLSCFFKNRHKLLLIFFEDASDNVFKNRKRMLRIKLSGRIISIERVNTRIVLIGVIRGMV